MSMEKVTVKGLGAIGQRRFNPSLIVSGPSFQFESTFGYDMIHKDGSCMKDVPYCFSRSSIKFQGHTGHKCHWFFTQIGRFRTVTRVWYDAQCLRGLRKCALLFFKVVMSNFKFTQDYKIAVFDPNWVSPDRNSSLNSPMASKWCTQLEVA